VLLPLALAQFIASYAATNMNVAISSIAKDLGTDVHGVQLAITLFTLTMAALMIPGSVLTDIWGRKLCFRLGLLIYGLGALIAAFAQGLPLLITGYSIFEGVGSALMIPPIYILVTVGFGDLTSRARAFGIVSGAAGLGAATGPLIGGLVTTWISWRASFILQALVVALIIVLGRRIIDPRPEVVPVFDLGGAVLSALGLLFVVLGIQQSGDFGWLSAQVWIPLVIGLLFLLWFFVHIRRRERAGRQPLLSTRMFRSRTADLGLVTQNVQWLVMQGTFFVVSVYLQTVRGHNAIQTGLIMVPATVGILLASAAAERMARNRTQRTLVRAGFVGAAGGIALLLLLAGDTTNLLTFVPGLLLIGLGVGVMLTASVNVVQSSFPESDQGEISGLSRSVSNLGSSLGTAIVGSVLVGASGPGGGTYALALTVMGVFALLGLGAALLLPPTPPAPQPAAELGVEEA
jgi:MFS family permease